MAYNLHSVYFESVLTVKKEIYHPVRKLPVLVSHLNHTTDCPANKLLSWPAITPLSRLTYCAYLVHPVILYTYYYSHKTLMHWDDLEVAYTYLGNMCLAYAAAFIISLVYESPIMGLEKVFLGREKRS